MNEWNIHLLAICAALLIAVVAACGEWLHARRTARLGPLAFGPVARPRAWTRLVPPLRVASLAGAAWALVTLVSFNDLVRERDRRTRTVRHLMVLLDVSPSMLIADAGNASSTRMARASEVLRSVLDRVPGDNIRFSAAAFYTEARMLVEQCQDRELLLHLAGGVPFHITYRPGKTDLLKSINQAGGFIKDWQRKSTTLLVISDGDSLPPSGLDRMPSSVAEVIVAGVGDPGRGTFIDGHMSRQDTANLSQLARRLSGRYYDCNMLHVPSEALRRINSEDPGAAKWRADRRVLALVVLAASSSILCLLPLLLEWCGSAWRPRLISNPNPQTRPKS